MKLRMLFLPIIMPLIALLALTACIRPVNPQGTPIAPQPTAEAGTPTPAPTPTEVPDTVAEEEVKAIFAASIGLTATQPATMVFGLEGVRAFPLNDTLGADRLLLAHTVGLRSFDPLQHHVLAIYRRQPGEWVEVTRLLLDGDTRNPPQFAPDYVGEQSVSQVEVEPTHLWIEVQGGAGAHSGVYGLYSFDGFQLTEQVSGFSASPGAGEVRDLNGDGIGEVLLNVTDAYVFCYACGVRYVHYEVNRWTGAQIEPLTLTTLPDSTASDVRDLNNTLVDLAQRGLWQDALSLLYKLGPLPDDETLAWNAAYLRLNGEVKRDAIADSPYPLLTELFYGDYAAVIQRMDEVGADALFTPESPLIQDTPAVGWEAQMGDYILRMVEPQLADATYGAPANFLSGWAHYLKGDPAAARAAVAKAAALAPDSVLFAKSLDFLEPGEAIAQVTALANVNVRSGPGINNPIIGRLPAGTVAQITGRTAEGAQLWWQIVYPAGSEQRGWVSGNPQFTSATGVEGVPVVK